MSLSPALAATALDPGLRGSARKLFEDLIAFDSVSRNPNRPLMEFVVDYLAGHGVKATLLPTEDGKKANLYATIGPEGPDGVVLSGHTDVVPVDGQDWTSDPFKLTEKDGRFYGRGTCDMKGFVAAVLAMVPAFASVTLSRPVHIALSYDEEIGCKGVRPMLDHVSKVLPRPSLAIIGEPTSMKVVNAHKGIRTLVTVVKGRDGHSSRPDRGANAIMAAARLIGFLDNLSAELAAAGDPSGRFVPPCTTVNIGEIEGGTAVNIIAAECRFVWEYRALPTDHPDGVLDRFEAHVRDVVLPDLQAQVPEATIETTEMSHSPSLKVQDDCPAETLALYLSGTNGTEAVSYGTEAGLFQAYDIPAVVCGPGDIAQAHRPDEFMDTAQFDACLAFLLRLKDHLSR